MLIPCGFKKQRKHIYYGFLFYLFLLLTGKGLVAAELPEAEAFRIDLTQSTHYFFADIDTPFKTIQSLPSDRWMEMVDNGNAFGYKFNKALWLKFNIEARHQSVVYLLFDYAILDDIQVYKSAESGVKVQYSGDHLPPSEREVQHRKLVVPLELDPGSNPHYVRIQTSSSYTVPLILLDKETFHQGEAANNMLLSGLTGAAAFMALLNLFGGLRLRHTGHLYYAAFATAFTLLNLSLHGYFRYHLLPIWPHINDMLTVVWSQVGGLSYALFLSVFLPLKKHYPVDYKICQAHAILCALLMGVSLVGFYIQVQMITHLLNAIFALYSMVLAVRTWIGGVRTAIYLVWGWVCLMIGVMAKALTALGLLTHNNFLFHSFDVGMTLNLMLIAFGLASRVVDIQEREKVAREEADNAKNLAIVTMEHYRALFEYAPIPMFKVNERDLLIEANEAFLTLFGYASQQELIAAKVSSRSVYCNENDYLKLFSDLRQNGLAETETKIRSKTGVEYWVRISVREMTDSDAIVYEGACIDITAQVEQQAFEHAAHKREVNQLEALVAGVAHYLNTPLGNANTAQSVVSGEALGVEKAYKKQKLTGKKLRNFLDVVQQCGQLIKTSLDKSINVVERFKELSPEKQPVVRTPINSPELQRILKSSLPRDIRQSLNLVIDDSSDEARLLPLQPLVQVLKKLIINAWCHGAASEVYIGLTDDADGLNLVVKDDGKGLSKDVCAEDLFAPFYAKSLSLQEVSGLDLFVVKTIVQNRLNGKVYVEEAALPDLHFHIWLPNP